MSQPRKGTIRAAVVPFLQANPDGTYAEFLKWYFLTQDNADIEKYPTRGQFSDVRLDMQRGTRGGHSTTAKQAQEQPAPPPPIEVSVARAIAAIDKLNTSEDVPTVYSDKKVGVTDWREWVEQGVQAQQLASKASSSQDFSQVSIPDQQGPLLILPFSDSHLGAWSTDLELFRTMTDEMLALGPARCRILLLGDLVEMAIKMRSVGEVTNQMWTPEMQANILESWLIEIQPMVLAATWCNHAVEREEKMSGLSTFKRMLYKYFIYHDGIGHMDLTVGRETYKLALSHRFGGHSIYNKTHGPNRYFKFEGSDREIACQGDIHTPAFAQYYDGPNKRLAITAGTLHTHSLYGRRHFSLYTIPAFPCFELYPDSHTIIPYWSVAEWKLATQQRQTLERRAA